MTQHLENPAARQQRLGDWIRQVEILVDQIADWSRSEGWTVERSTIRRRETPVGEYEVPTLHIQIGEGELELEPVASDLALGGGRVQLRAFPTLSRVKLLGGAPWTIMTDSNVPLRLPWTRETYTQLVHDLLS